MTEITQNSDLVEMGIDEYAHLKIKKEEVKKETAEKPKKGRPAKK